MYKKEYNKFYSPTILIWALKSILGVWLKLFWVLKFYVLGKTRISK